MITDMLGTEVKVDDYVVSFNHIYEVLKVYGKTYIRAILAKPSQTTRAKDLYSKECVVLSKEAVENWMKN